MLLKQSFEEYKSDKRFISPSDIKGCKTPLHFFFRKYKLPKIEPTPEMMLGSAYHTLILEPEDFNKRYIPYVRANLPFPNSDYRKEENRIYKERFFENAIKNKQIVMPEEDIKILLDMKNALFNSMPNIDAIINREVGYIEHNLFQVALFKDDCTFSEIVRLDSKEQIDTEFKDKNALFLATRPDYFNPINQYDLDLKTTKNASPYNMGKEIYSLEYYIQCAMGLDILTAEYGCEFEDFLFLCQEKEEPYHSALYSCSPKTIELGRFHYQMRLGKIFQAIRSNHFAGYEINRMYEAKVKGAIELDMPNYAIQSIEMADF